MPIFKIEPVNIKTTGGYDAVITGIETDTTDCIVGSFKAAAGDFDAKWDKNGTCRGKESTANLNSNSDEFQEIINAAQSFGA